MLKAKQYRINFCIDMTRRVTKWRLERHAMMIAKIFGYTTMTKKTVRPFHFLCVYDAHLCVNGNSDWDHNTKTCSCLNEFSPSVYMYLQITADSLYIVFYTKVFFSFSFLRHWLCQCNYSPVFEHLLHCYSGLGFVLHVCVFHLCSSLVNLWK